MTPLDIMAALFSPGIPIFLLSCALVLWALHEGLLNADNAKGIQGSITALGKTQKDRKNSHQLNPVLAKWFRFGGGFYGVVALYTWLLIEWEDVFNFLSGLGDILLNLQLGALFRLLIELFIESIMNFVVAISWPAYWLRASHDAWILFLAAYSGYWLGIRAALYGWRRGWVSRAIDRANAARRRGGGP